LSASIESDENVRLCLLDCRARHPPFT